MPKRRRRPSGTAGIEVAQFTSRRKPDVKYSVRVWGDGTIVCNCKLARYPPEGSGEDFQCQHVKTVVNRGLAATALADDIAKRAAEDRIREAEEIGRKKRQAAVWPILDILRLAAARSGCNSLWALQRATNVRDGEEIEISEDVIQLAEQLAPFMYMGGRPLAISTDTNTAAVARGTRVIVLDEDDDA